MHPLTPGGAPGTAMARGMPRAAMARGMPRAAMARGDWMPKSNRSRGFAWLANRDNQPAVFGWPIVTIINHQPAVAGLLVWAMVCQA